MMHVDRQLERVARALPLRLTGRVRAVSGLTITAAGLPAPIGAACEIETSAGSAVEAQVVGFRDDMVVLMALGDPAGIATGQSVRLRSATQQVPVGPELLGRVVDASGEPLDEAGPIDAVLTYPLFAPPPPALQRRGIDKPLSVGLRSINGLITAGLGQRLGVFAGTGVGKSVLLGMMARYTSADVNVIALIGERGREVRAFIENDLGPQGLRRSVVVVSTSDQSPVLRVRALFAATSIAEYFRDQGANVLLLADSITRTAMAQRQIGLAAGEPPATKGYPPSVFSMLPQALERAGRTATGSITGFYTVLVEGDDVNEPIADAARGILDGHVWLSRRLASRGHYPAVDVLESISRVMIDVVSPEHMQAARRVRRLLATWNEIEDLVNIGAYAPGTNAEFDLVIQMRPAVEAFLTQAIADRATFEETQAALLRLASEIERTEATFKARDAARAAPSNVAQPRPAAGPRPVATMQRPSGRG